jgi:hypothetical protein
VQRRWLGDALDFWKGAFVGILRASSTPLWAVKVLPMFTDAGWTIAEIETYAAILGVPVDALVSTSQLTKGNRSSYLTAVRDLSADVLVDPDTGISTDNKPKPSHVTASEVFAMLTRDNVVVVYQHRPRWSTAGWLARYAQLLTATGAVAVSYESAQVGMLFATRSTVREAGVRQVLADRLSAAAVVRGTIPARVR